MRTVRVGVLWAFVVGSISALMGTVVSPAPAGASTYSTAVLADAPTAYWRLDEGIGSGSAADSSASGSHTATNADGWQFGIGGAAPGGTAARFTQDWSPINGDQDFATTSRTVEAWVRQNPGTSGTHPIFWVRQNTSVGGSPLEMVNGRLHATIRGWDGTFSVTGTQTLDDGQWHQVAMTAGGGALILYVDGAMEAATGMSGSVYPGGNLEATIGFRPTNLFNNISFTGDLDEIAVYPSVLSASRIAQHYVASGRGLMLAGGALTSDERRGGGSPSQLCPVTCDEDPVTSPDGEFWQSFDGFTVPGRGRGLSWSLSYSSTANSTDGPLGFGWTHDLGLRVELDQAGTQATIVEERGSKIRFVLTGGVWAPASPRTLAQLTRHGDGSWTFTRRHGAVFEFGADGRLTSQRDRNGEGIDLTYSGGLLSTVTDDAGRTVTFTWDAGHIASVTDPLGREVSFGYVNGELRSYTDVAGGTWQFAYDAAHRVTSTTTPRQAADPTPAVTENHYDAQGRIDWQRDPLNQTATFDYTTLPDGVVVTDPADDVVARRYLDGVPIEVIEGYGTPDAVSTVLEYDPATARVTRMSSTAADDPAGATMEFEYDARGNRTLTRDGLGHTWVATFNGLDAPVTATDANGVITTYTYTAAGNPATVSTPLTGSQPPVARQIEYLHGDPAHPGDVTGIIDARGKTWGYELDEFGHIVAVTDPNGGRTTTEYNLVGWVTRAVSARGNEVGAEPDDFDTTFDTHNPWGDWTHMTDPAGEETSREFDANRLVTAGTDAAGNITSYVYDDADQLVEVQRPDGTFIATQWRPDGLLAAQLDAAGEATVYDYDSLDRMVSTTDPLGRITRHRYDAAGKVVATQQPGGDCASTPATKCITRTYDAAERLTGIGYSDPGTPDVTAVTYDDNGQRTALTDATGTSSWGWDSLGRLTTSTTPHGGTVGYGYDLTGNVTTIAYPHNAGTVTRTFDDSGRLESVTDWFGKTSSFDYDASSNPVADVLGNGTTVSRVFNERDLVTSVLHERGPTTLSSFDYTRDELGRNAAVVSTGVPADNHGYDYNPLSFLTDIDDNTAITHRYDPADNLTRLADGTLQQFDVANQLTESSRISFVGTNAADVLPVATTIEVGLPADAQPGDQAIVAAVTSADSAPPTIAGYTFVHSVANQGDSAAPRLDLYRRTLQAGDSTVTASYPNQIAASKALQVAVYRGLDPADPVTLVPNDVITYGTQVPVYAAPGATAGQQRVVFEASYSNAIGAVWSASGPLVQRFPQTSNSALISTAVADHLVAVDGDAPAATVTSSQPAQLLAASLLLRPQTRAYTYSSQGSRTTATTGSATTTYGYDQAQRLTQFTSGSTTATYTYRGDGQRASKSVDTGAGAATTVFTWDESAGLPLLLSETTAGKQVNYIYGPGGQVLEQIAARPTPTRVGAASAVDTAGTADSLTVNFPAVAPRDQIILVTTANQSVQQGVPAGYTWLSSFGDPSGGVTIIARRTAAGGETSATVSYGNGSLQNKSVGVVIYRGVDPVDPVVTVGSPGSAPSQLTSPTPVIAPSVTAVEPGEQLIVVTGVSSVSGGDGKWLPPGGMALAVGTSTGLVDHGLMIADQSLIAPGPTGSRTTQYFSTLSGLGSVALTLRPAPAPAFYYHADQLGSIRSVTDEHGNVAATATYDPYGHTAAQTTAPGTNLTNPFGFAGEYQDAESGLTYLRARYYDPASGQFLTRDPIEALTREPYGYAGSDPINGTDPTGLFHYTLNFDLGRSDQSPEELFAYWMGHFAEVFPVRGAPDQLADGSYAHLNAYGIPFRVRVGEMSSHGFRFNTLGTHPDYPGWVEFNITQEDDCHLNLEVHGYVPYHSAGGLVPKRVYRGIASRLWSPLADNLRVYLNPPRGGGGGSW